VLDGSIWEGLVEPSLEIDIRRGDADDPLRVSCRRETSSC
jgi:hypothetical protein